jgi:hypothetical protein
MTQYLNDSMAQSLWSSLGQPPLDALGDFLVNQTVVQDSAKRRDAQKPPPQP